MVKITEKLAYTALACKQQALGFMVLNEKEKEKTYWLWKRYSCLLFTSHWFWNCPWSRSVHEVINCLCAVNLLFKFKFCLWWKQKYQWFHCMVYMRQMRKWACTKDSSKRHETPHESAQTIFMNSSFHQRNMFYRVLYPYMRINTSVLIRISRWFTW